MLLHVAREFESATNRSLPVNGCSRAARYSMQAILVGRLTEIKCIEPAILRVWVFTERVDEYGESSVDVDEPGV